MVRQRFLSFRVNCKEIETIKAIAQSKGMTVSTYIRKTLKLDQK
ncbi:DUF6290 family protein [Paenibacillus sp. D9]